MEQPAAENNTTPNYSFSDMTTSTPNECGDGCTIKENIKGPFTDPVYKELSRINGEINKLTKEELTSKLSELHLETRGTKEVIKKRLKAYYKTVKLDQALLSKDKTSKCPYKYLCVVDFEATCDEDLNFHHEIIEFPAVLLNTSDNSIVAEFHEYCRPLLKPVLTEFCKTLTGISQEMVDGAETFPTVLQRFIKWMEHYSLGISNSFSIVTDSSYDMGQFLVMQCDYSDVAFPNFGKKWINIRKTYSNFYKTPRLSIPQMLDILGMTFEGRQHCGIDDARNIARIVIQMLKDGANIIVNERLKWNSLPCKFADEGYFKGAVPESGDSNHSICHKNDQFDEKESLSQQRVKK